MFWKQIQIQQINPFLYIKNGINVCFANRNYASSRSFRFSFYFSKQSGTFGFHRVLSPVSVWLFLLSVKRCHIMEGAVWVLSSHITVCVDIKDLLMEENIQALWHVLYSGLKTQVRVIGTKFEGSSLANGSDFFGVWVRGQISIWKRLYQALCIETHVQIGPSLDLSMLIHFE